MNSLWNAYVTWQEHTVNKCEIRNCWARSKHNVTKETTAEFTSNSTANINSQNARVVFFLFRKNKNEAAKKLCGGVAALKIRWKLTFGSSSCNIVGFRTHISMELGYTREIYLKSLRRKNLAKVNFLKLKPPRMFSLTCNLMIYQNSLYLWKPVIVTTILVIILAFSNNLAQVWITTSKTILDIELSHKFLND